MHTLKIFWEMGNLTFSAMCVVVFVLLYSNITLGKASRTAKTALLSFSLLIHIAFFAVSYIMYGNVAVLMLNDLRILFNILNTTQDSKIQNILDEEYADPSNYPDPG